MTELSDSDATPTAVAAPTPSELEGAWARGPIGQRLVATREAAYDFDHSMFYFPRAYHYEAIDPRPLPPLTEEWVASQFSEMVLGQDQGRRKAGKAWVLPNPGFDDHDEPFDDHGFLEAYLRAAEDLVYGGFLDGLLADASLTQAEKLVKLLGSELLGNRRNERNLDVSALERKLGEADAAGLPLQFVVPAFPFKDQNPFRVDSAPPDHVDAGEVALLVRLHALALAVWQIHTYGAEWIILSDGVAYAPIFGMSTPDAARYRSCLSEYRTRLNMTRTIHILDLQEATDRLGRMPREGVRRRVAFSEIADEIEQLLRVAVHSREEIKQRFNVFVRGMKMNIELRSTQRAYGPKLLWDAVMGDHRPSAGRARNAFDEVARRADQAAYSYASHTIATRYTRLYNSLFPHAVRATVHPKPGQIALPRLGSVDPWNGVPIIERGEVRHDSVRIEPLYTELRVHRVRRRYVLNGVAPFAYEVIR